MDDMRERLARRLYHGQDTDITQLRQHEPLTMTDCLDIIDTLKPELRVPDEAMLRRASEELFWPTSVLVPSRAAEEVWQAMIDAIGESGEATGFTSEVGAMTKEAQDAIIQAGERSEP